MTRRSMAIRHKALLFVVTCGFIGYLPVAPGTYASALGGILLYFFPFTSPVSHSIFVAGLLVFSIICINSLSLEKKDPGYVVIDELAGMYIAMIGHRPTLFNVLAAFALFRIFDIFKPFPVNKAEELKKGYGIVADDVVAGVYANCILTGFTALGRLL
jgi:phosphatidylglycerophosphatase A